MHGLAEKIVVQKGRKAAQRYAAFLKFIAAISLSQHIFYVNFAKSLFISCKM